MSVAAPRPYALIAELTHACPLRCAYCSNPLELAGREVELDTGAWKRVLGEAEAAGVVQVTFTGGEPLVRDDLEGLVAEARRLELYATLITSGIPWRDGRVRRLAEAGLDAVQLSVQGTVAEQADAMAGGRFHDKKLAFAEEVRAAGLPLTLNVVLHRGNVGEVDEIVALAERIGARRLELATVQHLGWALANRSALLASAEEVTAARAAAVAARRRLEGRIEVIYVAADHHAGKPRACMGGWGRRYVVVAPDGTVLPCHAARGIAGLAFARAGGAASLGEIWTHDPGMNAFRGDAWMPEPCRSCERKEVDFGGCRCQAFALTGDAAATDPACDKAPRHDLVVAARAEEARPALARLRTTR